MVRHLPSVWETWVRSLGREDHLEKGMAIHSCTLAWKIPWSAHGVQKRHIQLSNFTFFLSFFLSYSDFNYPALMYISILTSISLISGLPRWLVTKNPPANSGDIRDKGSIPGMGRSPRGMATHSSILAWRLPQTEEGYSP